jgi:hypothetical protein
VTPRVARRPGCVAAARWRGWSGRMPTGPLEPRAKRATRRPTTAARRSPTPLDLEGSVRADLWTGGRTTQGSASDQTASDQMASGLPRVGPPRRWPSRSDSTKTRQAMTRQRPPPATRPGAWAGPARQRPGRSALRRAGAQPPRTRHRASPSAQAGRTSSPAGAMARPLQRARRPRRAVEGRDPGRLERLAPTRAGTQVPLGHRSPMRRRSRRQGV